MAREAAPGEEMEALYRQADIDDPGWDTTAPGEGVEDGFRMVDPADEWNEQQAEIARLRERNRELEAEVERLKDEVACDECWEKR